MSPLAVLVGLALATAACSPAGPPPAPAPVAVAPVATSSITSPASTTTGRIEGRIRFAGEPPILPPLPVLVAPETCGLESKPCEALLVGADRGVANVVVMLPDLRAAPGAAAATPPVPLLDQRACVFHPHVLLARAGQPIQVRNSDDVLHNVHAFTAKGHYSRFNVGLPAGDATPQTVSEAKPGALALQCDAGHRWMRAYIYVLPGPLAAKSDPAGRFAIAGVPPGTHRLRAWHESLGEVETRVTVEAGKVVTLELVGRLEPAAAMEVATGPTGAAP